MLYIYALLENGILIALFFILDFSSSLVQTNDFSFCVMLNHPVAGPSMQVFLVHECSCLLLIPSLLIITQKNKSRCKLKTILQLMYK